MSSWFQAGLEFGRGVKEGLLSYCHHAHQANAGRFAGIYFIDSITGELTVAQQQIPLNTPVTAPIVFIDDTTTPPTVINPGPIGSVALSDPTAGTAALSADGQAANVTVTASNVLVTLTWSGTGSKGPFAFSVDLSDQVAPPQADAGSFGQFVPGTTP